MAITARLSHKLRQTLGDAAAEDLVNWMQQVDAQRVELRELNELNFSRIDARLAEAATRADLTQARQEMQSGFARSDAKLAESDGDVRQELQSGLARPDAKLADLRQEMQSGFARSDAKLADLRQEMQSGFARSDAKLAAFHEEMRLGFSELQQEMAHLEARLERRTGDLIRWSFVFWVGAVGAIAMLAGALRSEERRVGQACILRWSPYH